MKSIIMAAALCISFFTASAQINISKDIKIQDLSLVKKIVFDCNQGFLTPRVEYKPFIDYMKRTSQNSCLNALNFHIKYSRVITGDSALHTNNSDNTESLVADFLTHQLDCSSIIGKNIPFTGLDYSSDDYNVSLATNMGRLTFTNISTGKAKSFTLSPLGYGIYSGSTTSNGLKETVVVVLNRWRFCIGG